MVKTGIGFFGNLFNTLTDLGGMNSDSSLQVISARVTDIILDESHPNFSKLGGWTSIGTIFFEKVNSTTSPSKNLFARPFFPQFKNPPLCNEIVLLFELPDKNMGKNDTSTIYYYLNQVSIWNNPHHNAYPNVYKNYNDSPKKDYQFVEAGIPFKSKEKYKGLDLNGPNSTGGNFEEKSNINPIIPFSGDNIIEGRFGSSLRLGSTIKNNTLFRNNWSEYGSQGDPILILRNGQSSTKNNTGFIPTVENINEDLSSIYMTSTQNLPISASSLNYTAISKNQTPDYPGSYTGKSQIILNSGRLVLNSVSDSILLSSPKIINLAANGDIGLASRKAITLEADEINIGGSNSSQPAISGETFLKSLKSLTFALQGLANALNNDPKVGPATQFAGNVLNEQLQKFNSQYDSFTSKKVKLS